MTVEYPVRVTVLGPVQAWVGDDPVDLGARMQRALLARLVAARGHTVSVDRLIHDLWEGEPPPKALSALQVYVSHLRRVLEPDRQRRAPARILVSAAPGYCLRLPDNAVDSWRFEAKVAAAQEESDARNRVRLLGEALAGWAGEPFAGAGDALWAAPEALRLTELRLAAVESHAAALVDLARYSSAIAALEGHVAEHPGREGAAAVLATALYRTGRQANALEVLRRTREHLIDELGLEPGRALRDLERDILRQADHLEPSRPAPLRSTTPAAPEAAPRAPVGHVAYGRAEELAAIDATARGVAAGASAVLWIGGEAGSGKTTLAAAAAARLRAAGWRTVHGRCQEVHGAPAGWAWTEVLRELVDSTDHDRQALAPLLHDGAAAEQGTFWLGQAVADALGTVADDQPLAVVLDDLHRTDGLTLELLRLVADRIQDRRVLVMATYRPSEDRGELEVARAALTVHTSAHLILGGLDAAATAAVAADCGLTTSGEALRLLRERTGGNPLFVRELARLMAAEGPDAVWASVPVGVRDVLRRRLARLPGPTVTALRQAAVLGRDIDVDLLAELGRSDPDDLLDALEPAVLLGLLDEPSPGRLQFAHGLVRDTLYEDTSKLRRSRLHGAALELLRAPGRSVDQAALAHHAVASATAETASAAADFATAAARDAGSVGAHAEAARQWRAAVQMLELAASRQLAPSVAVLDQDIEVRCGLIAALAQSGDAVTARSEMKCALQLVSGRSRDDLVVRILTAWDTPLVWRDREYDESDGQMIGLLRHVLAGDVAAADRIRLLKALYVELEGNDPDGALAASTEMLALARQVYADDPGAGRLLCTALNVHAFCALGPDLDTERDVLAAELLQTAEAAEQADYQAVAHWLLSLAAGNRCDLATAKRHVDLAVARASTGQLVHLLGVLGLFRARMYLLAGRLDEAVSAYTDLAARMAENGAANGAKLAMVGRTTGEFCLGDLGTLADELLFFYREISVAALDAAVLALFARGREAEARELWPDRKPIERAYFWVPFTVLRVNAAVAMGDLDEVRARSAELARYSGSIAGLGVDGLMVGPVDDALAAAADVLDRPDEARDYRKAAETLRDRLAAEARSFID